MTADLAFAGYRSIEAGPDDPLRVKWNTVSRALEVPAVAKSASELNVYINRLVTYRAEPVGDDVWQTPQDTLKLGRGDCEDYAILKYALLRATTPVRLVVGEIKQIAGNRPHAWCAAYLANEWHALDSMFDRLIPVNEYINWLPLAAMRDDCVVRFGREFKINEKLNAKA